ELMHRREPADHDPVADLAVAAEGGAVREGDVGADAAVVPDMAVRHEEAAVAHGGDAAAVLGAAVHGDAFTQIAVDADDEAGRPAPIARRPRRRAAGAGRTEPAARPGGGFAGDMHG